MESKKRINYKKIVFLVFILVLVITTIIVTFVVMKNNETQSKENAQIPIEEIIESEDENVATILNSTYGQIVSNYVVESAPDIQWKVLYSDNEHVYLIASDYIEIQNVPHSVSNGVVTEHTAEQSENFARGFTLTNIVRDYDYNATSFMLDKTAWNGFVTDFAEYAIGGPTIEMLFDSYNEKYGTKYECQKGERGYLVRKCAGEEWKAQVLNMLAKDSLYTVGSPETAPSMWLASQSDFDTATTMILDSDGTIATTMFDQSISGFRPVVCLKSDVQLVEDDKGGFICK